MQTMFYRDGQTITVDAIRHELRSGADDAGVPQEMADSLLADALADDVAARWMIEELIAGLECVTEIGFGER